MATGSKITAIQVQNFKSIGKTPQTLQIRPLTILAGANSSGKSTLMQPLLLLKQTLESEFDPGPLRLDGPNVRLSEASQIISRVPGADRSGFQFRFRVGDDAWFGFEFGYARRTRLSLVANTWQEKLESPVIRLMPDPQMPRGSTIRCLVARANDFENPDECHLAAQHLMENCARVLHVNGIRGNPQRTYQHTGRTTTYFPGLLDAYTASLVDLWQQEPRRSRMDKLEEWLAELQLTYRLEATRLNDVTVELKVGRLPAPAGKRRAEMVSIADVGFGVSQVLPALVAMLAAPRGAIIYIEQPELHLHPNPQVKLARILRFAAERSGASIVVETHSSLLIREIQTLVAEGKLDPSILSLNWCNRDPKTGATTVTQAELGKDGSYGDWPIDFDDVAMASERRYWDATAVRKRR